MRGKSIFQPIREFGIRKMVSFVIGKEIEKDVFRLVTSVGQRKYSDEKHLSLFLYRAQNFPSLSF